MDGRKAVRVVVRIAVPNKRIEAPNKRIAVPKESQLLMILAMQNTLNVTKNSLFGSVIPRGQVS